MRYISQHNVEDVVFTDEVPYADLPRYYRSADVFCAPNTGHESLGLIILEAMASGAPIVATNIQGFKDVLTEGVHGLLVPPKDSDALAEALKRMLGDAAMREEMGRAGSTAGAGLLLGGAVGQGAGVLRGRGRRARGLDPAQREQPFGAGAPTHRLGAGARPTG